ncbi:hypothetical protein EG329_008750 [Mollisiaceae sp. DMI_Dod_QoI]|nr:hypothetical protein EG329_008750 [Helotiales sp. DMI_Dod_QoI]
MCLSCFKSSETPSGDNNHDLQPPRIAQQKAHKEKPDETVQKSRASKAESPVGQQQAKGQDSNAATPFPANDPSHQLERGTLEQVPALVNGTSSKETNSNTTSKSSIEVKPASTSAEVEAASLWQEAHKKLAEQDPDLIRDLETIIKEDAGLDPKSDIKIQMEMVVQHQKMKMESKQWSFNVLGIKEVKVRESVDSILSLIDQSRDLIAAGMTFAPVYVSIPWTAVSSLIPIILKDAKEHQDAIDGLERVAKILWCYTIAEEGMLPDPNTKSTYRTAVLDLYVTLLQYQAMAARYFGASTIKRIWRNVTTTTTWSDISAKIVVLDNDCRRCISFLGFKEQQRGNVQLMTLLEDHSKTLKLVLARTDNEKYEKQRVLDWISMIKYGADHETVRESLGESYLNRGQWLFNDNQAFKDWQRSSSGVFLLKGTVGTGKSSLTSIVIQDFIDTPAAYLAYFYCSRKEKTTRRSDTTMIIRSLIRCLSVNGHPAFKNFVEDYRNSESRREDGCELQLRRCITLLQESFLANPTKSIVIIVDALDECVDPDGLLAALKLIWESGQQNLRLFLSSRLGVDVKATFPTLIEADIGESNTADIQYYLQTEIESRRSKQKDSVMTSGQAKELEKVLIDYAGGMFKWIILEVEIFLGPDIMFEDTIDEKIESLKRKDLDPIDQLNEAYDQVYLTAIGKNDPNRKLVVETALQWMLHAYEEFRIESLALIASIKSNGTALRPFPTTRLLRMCSNFIVANNSGVLRLAHLTVRPYLESRETNGNPFLSSSANLRAAMICLRFLNPDEEDPSLRKLCEKDQTASHKVRTYSNKYWTLHSKDAKINDQTPEELNSLIKQLYKNSLPSSPMHVAVRDGQVDAVQYGIATGADIDAKNLLGNTSVQESVRWKSLPVLKLLLASGAAVDSQNNVGDTALHIASRSGLVDFAEELLRHEADTNLPNYHGFAPLHISAHYGHSRIVQLLLRFGANVDQEDPRGNTTLHFASMTIQEDIVRILLGAGCKKQIVNKDGDTPLALAKRNESVEVETLLELDQTAIRRPSIVYDEPSSHGTHSIVETQKVDFDISGLCTRCDLRRWYKSALQGLSDAFYSSYRELLESAKKGCPMCQVFVQEMEILGLDSDYLNTLTSGITIQVILCSTMAIRTLGQDLLVISLGSDVRLELEICIDRAIEHKLGHIFGGRTLDVNPWSNDRAPLVQDWIKQCESQHPNCQRNLEQAEPPTRAINIQNFPHIFLEDLRASYRDRPTRLIKYAYLSFSWGGPMPFATRHSSMDEYSYKLEVSKFPKTLREAIELASSLDIPYLWIDALCIIQDDNTEKTNEISRMGEYIENATCVISALASTHSDGGIFVPRSQSSVSLLAIPVLTEDEDGGYLHLRRKLSRPHETLSDFVAKRAWRVQESALPQRILYCQSEQLFWNCATCMLSEGSILAQKPILRLNIRPLPTGQTVATATNNPLESWYSLVEVTSASVVTISGDKLPAVMAPAAAVQRGLSEQSHFSHGVWEDDVWRGLLWRPQQHMRLQESYSSYSTKAPTWSWASLDGPISYSLAMSIHSNLVESDLDARVIEIYHTDPDTAYQYYGNSLPDQANNLKISANAMQLASLDLSLNCECFFDLAEDEIKWLDDRSNADFVAILLCKWYSDASEAGSRWLGLVLQPVGEDSAQNVYRRVGLFLGPQNDMLLTEWKRWGFERREFLII